MKKDGRFWILVGALVIVAGLFVAFVWSVLAAPSEPATVTVNPVVNGSGPAATAASDGKPVEPAAPGDMSVTFNMSTEAAPPAQAVDVTRVIEDARRAADQARADAERVAAETRARVNRAAERARAEAARARAAASDKPEDDGKPPEDY